MIKLTISLAYNTNTYDNQQIPEADVVFPVKALDAEGSVLAEGAVSVNWPLVFDLTLTTELVFVRLTWPSGRSETQRVDLKNLSCAFVTFNDSKIASNEWSAWAMPKLNPKTPFVMTSGNVDLQLDRFDRVWLRLWKYTRGGWGLQKLSPEATYRSSAAWQLDLFLDSHSWLLQIGGLDVAWRFVSLPGSGPVRILITPKDSTDPRADVLKVVVTSFRTDAETLLEFLARDAMHAAITLANSTSLAEKLFANKFNDPISAIAGAYYLLRSDAWQSVNLQWFENLSRSFSWLPDTSIIYCIRLLRGGLNTASLRHKAKKLFVQCLKCGWPVYREGIILLEEAAALLRNELDQKDQLLFNKVQALSAAKAWSGATASFYGGEPEIPNILKLVGMPKTLRKQHSDRKVLQKHRTDLLRSSFHGDDTKMPNVLKPVSTLKVQKREHLGQEPLRRETNRGVLRSSSRSIVAPTPIYPYSKTRNIKQTFKLDSSEEEFLLGSIS